MGLSSGKQASYRYLTKLHSLVLYWENYVRVDMDCPIYSSGK